MKSKLLKIATLFLFVSFYSCTEETIYITPEDTEGRVNVYIEGDITNEEAAAQLKAEIGTLTENIYVQHTTALTEINIYLVGDIHNITVKQNESLESLIINGKDESTAKEILIEPKNNHIYTEINGIKKCNIINYLGGLSQQQFICNDMESIAHDLLLGSYFSLVSFNNLKYVGLEAYQYDYVSNIWLGYCHTLSMPKLEEISRLDISNFGTNATLSFPSLKKIRKELLSDYGLGVQNFDFPKLEYCKTISILAQNNLNPNFYMPLFNYCENFRVGQTGMTQEKINGYLNKFLTIMPQSGKTIDFSEEFITPTGQGLLDKQTLMNQGNTVLTF